MRRAAAFRSARELDSITSSLAKVRVLHHASAQPMTATAIAEQLLRHGAPGNPARILASMTRSGLLAPKASSRRESPEARAYAITTKGRQTLNAARKHLRQLAAP